MVASGGGDSHIYMCSSFSEGALSPESPPLEVLGIEEGLTIFISNFHEHDLNTERLDGLVFPALVLCKTQFVIDGLVNDGECLVKTLPGDVACISLSKITSFRTS